jgi:hypothetical protein
MTDLAALTLIGSARVRQCRLSPLAGAVQHLGLRIRLDLLHAMQCGAVAAVRSVPSVQHNGPLG